MRANSVLENMWTSLTYALRRLAAAPGFAFATIASVGLGIGANAAVFSIANALLMRHLPVPRADELVRVYSGPHSPLGYRRLVDVRTRMAGAVNLFGETQVGASLSTGNTEPERVRVSLVSGDMFAALEAVPAAGRLFTGANDREDGSTPQVVLSHEFWQRRFARDPRVVGSTVRLNAREFEVIGVSPAGLSSSQTGWWSDVVVPVRDARALIGVAPDSLTMSFYVSGRLATGVSRDQAGAQLAAIAANIRQADTLSRGFSLRIQEARGVTEEVRLPAAAATGFMLVISLLVLVMAATNVGNLMLARNARRRRELGVRAALGASRQRLLALLLAESAVLTVCAAAVAMVLAHWTTAILPRLIPSDAEVRFVFRPDWSAVVFTGLVAMAAMFVFGLVPARAALRADVMEGIKTGMAIGGGRVGARLRRQFLLVQVALCAILLTTGSLFVRSLAHARDVNVGFRPQGVVVTRVDLEGRPLSEAGRTAFFQRALAQVRQLPGIEAASYSRIVELMGSNSETRVTIEGERANGDGGRPSYFNTVGPDYHRTLGIPLVRGRDLATTDVASSPPVAVVNETFASRMWPGKDPIGQRTSFDGVQGPWFEVVGLSRNVKYHTLGEGAKSFVVVSYAQSPTAELALEARVAAGASALSVGASVVRVLRDLDPALAPPQPQLLTEIQQVVLLPARLGASLLGGIGVLAFLLAAVGVGGVAAYTVTQRTREIGVRIALGAQPGALLRTVLGDTWRTVATGSLVGLLLALGVGRVVASQLYGISFADPVTFVVVPLLLVLLGLLAVLLPARRAMAIPPIEALRAE